MTLPCQGARVGPLLAIEIAPANASKSNQIDHLVVLEDIDRAAEFFDRLIEAEINPLLVLGEGKGMCAADGLVILRGLRSESLAGCRMQHPLQGFRSMGLASAPPQ